MSYLNIFDKGYLDRKPVTGVGIPRDLEYLKRTYNYNKAVIEDYYLTRVFAVKNTNIVSRLVDHLTMMLDSDFYDFLAVSEDTSEYVGKFFRFTSGIEKGIVHPPNFYGNSGSEIILSTSRNFNKDEVILNWRTYPCLEVNTHQRNDLKLLLPTGRDDGSKGGLATISINLVILNVKYREFLKEQRAIRDGLIEGGAYTKNVFVMKYVLPGLLESHIDHVMLNRVMDTFYEEPIVEPALKNPFVIFEPTTQVNRYVEQTLDSIAKKKLDFVGVMNNINLIFSTNARTLLGFDDIPTTRQNRWAFLITRLRHMCFLYDASIEKGLSKQYIADWKMLVRRMENDDAIFDMFNSTETQKIKEYIEKIKDM